MMTAHATLSDVLDAATEGGSSVSGIAQRTGLTDAMVRVALDRLSALNLLERETLSSGCPASGCSGCPGSNTGAQGCPGVRGDSGPVCFSVVSYPGGTRDSG